MNRRPLLATPAEAKLEHGIAEDALGLAVGGVVVSLGLFFLKSGGVVTGGTAGLSLLLSHTIAVPFGVLFVLVNLPFFLLAIRGKGWDFTLRSVAAIVLVSGLSPINQALVHIEDLPAGYAVVVGNALCGVGLLILFRHRASLGGFNIVALMLQERVGLRAGYVLMILDTAVVTASLAALAPSLVLISAAGAVLLNLVLAFNHRPGRYLGR